MRIALTYLLLVLLSLAAAVDASAQKIRFSDTGNSWHTRGVTKPGCEWERTAGFGKDTVISGQHYRKVNYSLLITSSDTGCTADMGKGFFVREDVAAGKVFYRLATPTMQEQVLYNYNMNLGDTIQYRIGPTVTVADSVVGVDSVLISGISHKVLDFQSKEGRGYRAYSVIEGVGCTNNPVFPAFVEKCGEYIETLTCFLQNGLASDFLMRQNYCYPLGNNFIINCDAPTLRSTRLNSTQAATIFPNPANTAIEVRVNNTGVNSLLIAAYDLSGKCVYRAHTTGQGNAATINTSDWKNGMHLVTVQTNDGGITKEMVVISQ